MSTTTNPNGTAGPSHAVATADRDHRSVKETKPSFKTTELIAYVLAVVGVFIASAVVDVGDDGQVFSPYQAWRLITFLTIGYMISRGLAKAGSRNDG